MRYRFDQVELDADAFELRVDGVVQPVEPQVFEVLTYLIRHRDRMVGRTELLDAIWGDRFVSDSALASRIAAARAAIGDDGRAQRHIRTIHGRGLRFVSPVSEVDPDDPDPGRSGPGAGAADEPDPIADAEGDGDGAGAGAASEERVPGPGPDAATAGPSSAVRPVTVHLGRPPPDQELLFTTAPDGARLAVATLGSGPPLVKAANWLTHLEHDWASPIWRHWWTELGRRFRFVRYDARGCGLSEQDLSRSDLTDVDQWTDDLAAVVDACDLDRFALLGMSQGAVPAMAYAVRHPERVSHLVLYGAYARGMRLRGPDAETQSDTLLQLMRGGWGGTNPAFRTVFTLTFLPEATSEQMRWFNELQHHATGADNALQLEAAFHHLDVTPLAARVRVPTLVLHGRGDQATPYEEGRRLASAIPGAELVSLDSSNHILMSDEPAWARFLSHVDRFLAS